MDKFDSLKENEKNKFDKKNTIKNNIIKNSKFSINININKVVPTIKYLSKFSQKESNTIKKSNFRGSSKASKSNKSKKKFFSPKLNMDLLSPNSKSILKNSNNEMLFYKENSNRMQNNSIDLEETKRKSSKFGIKNVFIENCIKYIPKEERINIFNEEEF